MGENYNVDKEGERVVRKLAFVCFSLLEIALLARRFAPRSALPIRFASVLIDEIELERRRRFGQCCDGVVLPAVLGREEIDNFRGSLKGWRGKEERAGEESLRRGDARSEETSKGGTNDARGKHIRCIVGVLLLSLRSSRPLLLSYLTLTFSIDIPIEHDVSRGL